jgi:hypothetical protein
VWLLLRWVCMTFSTFYFGMDSSAVAPWPSCFPASNRFYIGCIGGADGTWATDFETATASAVGATRTSSYWSLAGPHGAPEGATAWGETQANAFISAWLSGTYASYVEGTTMFGDIEPGNNGWVGSTPADCQAMIHGFLTVLHNYDGGGYFTPGLYISKSNWSTYIGSYTSPIPFVLWLAGTSCPTNCSAAETAFNGSAITGTVLGGYRAMIWQYWEVSTDGCASSGNDTPYNGFLSGHWNPTT